MAIALTICSLLAVTASGGAGHRRDSATAISADIVRAVRRAEKSFADIEIVTHHVHFRRGAKGLVAVGSSIERFVALRNRLHWRADTLDCAREGAPEHLSETRCLNFDEEMTREMRCCDERLGAALAVETHGRSEAAARIASRIPRPHLVLIRSIAEAQTLADYMRSFDSMRLLDTGRVSSVDGVSCLVVELGGQDGPSVRLWLARDRDLIPMRLEAFDHDTAGSTRVLVAESSQWRPIGGGLVVPMRARITRMLNSPSQRGGSVDELHEIAVDRLDVSPRYTVDFFSPIRIPKGMLVRTDRGGNIVSAIHGQDAPVRGLRAHWDSLTALDEMLFANNLIVVLCALCLAHRFLKRRLALRSSNPCPGLQN